MFSIMALRIGPEGDKNFKHWKYDLARLCFLLKMPYPDNPRRVYIIVVKWEWVSVGDDDGEYDSQLFRSRWLLNLSNKKCAQQSG